VQRRLRLLLKKLLRRNLSAAERVESCFAANKPVRFLQIGSNDGRFGDPLVRLIKMRGNWSGIFVEPVPYSFERLKQNYGTSEKFVFEQIAIGEAYETKTFYYVSEEAKANLGDQLPPWYDQLGTFDRPHILKHLDGVLEPYIVEVPIDCVPLVHVLDKHKVEKLDILHIDTEGFDYQVLKQFDLARYLPKVVLFEHKHLSEDEQAAADAMLLAQGYELFKVSGDTFAQK
jgi:FkbM family methyltransferase